MSNDDFVEFPRDFHVSAENNSKFDDLITSQIFSKYDAPKKEIFIYAMTLGYINKADKPLGSNKIGSIPSRLLTDEQKWLVRAIAVAKSEKIEALLDIKVMVNLAEEYANGGISLLYDMILNPQKMGTPYKRLDAHARTSLEQLIGEKSSQNVIISKTPPSLMEIIQNGEGEQTEFKSSIRWDHKKNCVNKDLEGVIAKSVAAFLNADGGMLIIGVGDQKDILGIEKDLTTLGKQNEDGYELKIREIMNNFIGKQYGPLLHIRFEKTGEKLICGVKVDGSPNPAYVDNNGKLEFYIRSGNSSQPLNVKEATDYIANHWR